MARTEWPKDDLRELCDRAPLRRLIEEDCGQAASNGRYFCSIHGDHDPDLAYDAKANRFRCYGGSCGANGSAIDWLMLARGMTFGEAVKSIKGNSPAPDRPPRPHPEDSGRSPSTKRQAHLDDAWQSAVRKFIRDAREFLWLPEGRAARSYLHSRGLVDDTLRFFEIGFNPSYRDLGPFDVLKDHPSGLNVEVGRGIVIPIAARGSWFDDPMPKYQGAVMRRQGANPGDSLPPRPNGKPGSRYIGIKGTTRTELYPFPDLDPTDYPTPAILVEGEIDCMTAFQQARHLGIMATVGGAGCPPSRFAMDQLSRCSHILLAGDIDKAGGVASWNWRERFPGKSIKRALIPYGKDINEFHCQGGNVAEFIASEFRRFGIPPKPGDAFEGDLPESLPRLI